MEDRIIVDVRGLPCPQPVIRTRDAMLKSTSLDVLVSKADQVDNVTRMAARSGWTFESGAREDYFVITLRANKADAIPQVEPADLVCTVDSKEKACGSTVVVIESEYMGRGDDQLGKLLMKAFINTLKDCEKKPSRIVFFNSGVKLTTTESPVIESLRALSAGGIEILVCGTCLDFYGLKNNLGVGIISNMYDIAETMLGTGVVFIG